MTAFATLSKAHTPMWDAIRLETLRGAVDFAPRDVEKMVLSFATMRIDAPDLFNTVAQQAVMKMNKFTSLDVATMAYAFALVGRRDEVLMKNWLCEHHCSREVAFHHRRVVDG